ncbi:MAG: response regulator [Candidatus Liptonbacteria bacterium]|nr:response regulator [Candidatus Liptonbacteria bacterium]
MATFLAKIFSVLPGMPDGKNKILIVDDDADFLEIISIKLKKAGFDTISAQNGAMGVEAAKKEKPDLILMDVQMPVMNGVEAFFKLRNDPATSKIRLVFLTNYGEADKDAKWLDDKFAREIGAQDYIKKTEDLATIVSEIKKILE